MPNPLVAPYGTWKSPITSKLITATTRGLMEVAMHGDWVYWLEMRPEQQGRYVVVRSRHGGILEDVTPQGFNVRTRVHEYGGGHYQVAGDQVYFSNFQDQRLYGFSLGYSPNQRPDQPPRAITPEGDFRYADVAVDGTRHRLIAVREDHSVPGQEPINTLVAIPTQVGDELQVLAEGEDFYAAPRLDGDAKRLAWISWRHPQMPWDGSELWVAELDAAGRPSDPLLIAGGSEISVQQPMWSADGDLYFVSDQSGWWNIYRWRQGHIEPVLTMAAEFGVPSWVFRLSTYGFVAEDRILCGYQKDGIGHLGYIDLNSGSLESLPSPYTTIQYLTVSQDKAVFIGATPTDVPAVVVFDLASNQFSVLRRSSELHIDGQYISTSEPIRYPTQEPITQKPMTKGRLQSHGFYYAPKNAKFSAPTDQLPPLLVFSHGGPTGAAECGLKLVIQFWTSRGFAVLDVNYRGSSGYGRAYRQALVGQWGVADVDDCVAGARYLVEQGLVDSERLAIRGGSAGGYTTLAALTFRQVFKAGASYYGVSDLEALLRDTHKFESRYLDGLIGAYPECKDRYVARSPIQAVEQLDCPVIFFQGMQDKIVPPNQAEMMVEALKRRGLPVAYLSFADEQHGFRQAGNIRRSLQAELYFYSRVFGFEPADPLEPIDIENLPKSS